MRKFLFWSHQMATSCSVSLGCNGPDEACLPSSRLSMKGVCVHQLSCPGQGNPVAPAIAASGYNCLHPEDAAPTEAPNYPFSARGSPHQLQAALEWKKRESTRR
jgi:hypothetical protein